MIEERDKDQIDELQVLSTHHLNDRFTSGINIHLILYSLRINRCHQTLQS